MVAGPPSSGRGEEGPGAGRGDAGAAMPGGGGGVPPGLGAGQDPGGAGAGAAARGGGGRVGAGGGRAGAGLRPAMCPGVPCLPPCASHPCRPGSPDQSVPPGPSQVSRTACWSVPVSVSWVGKSCVAPVPRHRRLCLHCASNVVGDERHMVFDCTALQPVREQYSGLFGPTLVTMQQIMWQRDLVGVAHFVLELLGKIAESGWWPIGFALPSHVTNLFHGFRGVAQAELADIVVFGDQLVEDQPAA